MARAGIMLPKSTSALIAVKRSWFPKRSLPTLLVFNICIERTGSSNVKVVFLLDIAQWWKRNGLGKYRCHGNHVPPISTNVCYHLLSVLKQYHPSWALSRGVEPLTIQKDFDWFDVFLIEKSFSWQRKEYLSPANRKPYLVSIFFSSLCPPQIYISICYSCISSYLHFSKTSISKSSIICLMVYSRWERDSTGTNKTMLFTFPKTMSRKGEKVGCRFHKLQIIAP